MPNLAENPPARRHSVGFKILRLAEAFFPPDPGARMGSEEQTEHELEKASDSMGAYLRELGRTDVDVLD